MSKSRDSMNTPGAHASEGELESAMAPRLGELLKQALHPDAGGAAGAEPFDVSDAVLAALEDEAQTAEVGELLRAVLAEPLRAGPAGGAPRDDLPDRFADDVMAAIAGLPDPFEADRAAMDLSAYADGELEGARRVEVARRAMGDPAARAAVSEQAELGRQLREACMSAPGEADVWADVAAGIGLPEDEVAWERIGTALRAATAEAAAAPVDVADAVMAELEEQEAAPELPPAVVAPVGGRRWWAPVLGLALAAAVLFALLPGVEEEPSFVLASVNDAQVEDIAYAEGVVGTVIAPEQVGDVMVIVVDDSALVAGAGVTL